MKKAVITGGGGFIGSNLAHALVEAGYETHLVDTDFTFRDATLPKEATRHLLDMRETNALQQVFEGADVVFHTGALPRVPYSVEYPVETTDINITGTASVLTAAVRAKARRVVYSASSSAYGNQDTMPLVETMPAKPVHPYGLQKYVGELYAQLWADVYGLQTVCLRYFNVYGPGLDPRGAYALAVGKFLEARQNGTPITIFGDGTVTRDFTHVRDVVHANVLAAESQKVGKGEVINIGSGTNITIQALAEMFGGEIRYESPRIESHDTLADISRAKELLGWEPKIPLADGIAELKQLFGVA